MRPGRATVLSVAASLGGQGCASAPRPFACVDNHAQPRKTRERKYVDAPGDSIGVRVCSQKTMTGRRRVRGDGKVTLPFLNDRDHTVVE